MGESEYMSFFGSLVIGFFLSIYAGFISARVLAFRDAKMRAAVLTSQVGYSSTKLESLQQGLALSSELKMIALQVVEEGHRKAGFALEAVADDLIATIREKMFWREGLGTSDPNRIVYTPVFSEESIDAHGKAIRAVSARFRTLISLNLKK